MKPSTYEINKPVLGKVRIPRTNIGFMKNTTVKDFYMLFSKIRNQDYYNLEAKFINIITEEGTIENINDLRGLSETEKYGRLSTRLKSEIYFKSKDNKCTGKIENGNDDSSLSSLLTTGDILASIFSIPLGVPLVGVAFAFDGCRRVYNLFKKGILSVEVGPVGGVDSLLCWSHRIKESVNRLGGFEDMILGEEWKKDTGGRIEDLGNPVSIRKINEYETPDYSLDDIETFKNFVNYIKQIKL